MTLSAAGPVVLSIGEILIDLIASDGATALEDVVALEARPGGAPANAAVALSRLGVASAFCGVVGDDPFGRRLLKTLQTEHVDASRVRQADGEDTTLAFAWKDDRGDGHFRLLRMADALLSPEDVEHAGIAQMGAIVAGSVSLSAEPARSAIYRAVEIARDAGVPVCFDANVRPSLWPDRESATDASQPVLAGSDLIKVSLDDARVLLNGDFDGPEVVRQLAKYPVTFVVVTDGARGAWYGARNGAGLVPSELIPAFEVESVDPTGAGDAFTAATIARLIGNGWSTLTSEDVRFASAAGAIATTRRGAMSSLPWAAEVAAFLTEHDE